MGIECLGDVEIVGDEGLEPAFVKVFAWLAGAGDGDVGAAGIGVSRLFSGSWRERYLRAEEATLACEDRNKHIIAFGDLAHELGQAEVAVLGHGIELLLQVEGDDGHPAAVLNGHRRLWVSARHGG